MHGRGLAHMDIKPENIFLTKPVIDVDLFRELMTASTQRPETTATDEQQQQQDGDDLDEDECDADNNDENNCGDMSLDRVDENCSEAASLSAINSLIRSIHFKIGDLGLVTHAEIAVKEVFEGDCRYLAKELLDESIEKNLTKADVFAAGMTMIEVMSGEAAPKQGQEWHDLRHGILIYDFSDGLYSDALVDLVRAMISLDPNERPAAGQVVHRLTGKSKSQLKRELSESFKEIESLKQQLMSSSSSSGLGQSSSSSPVKNSISCSCGCAYCCTT